MNDSAYPKGSYVVFGGTFDPVHPGHVSAIRYLLERFDTLVLAPTAQNPWKDAPDASLKQRIQMLELVLNDEQIPWSHSPGEERVWLCTQPYVYVKDFVRYCSNQLKGKLHWAVGEDSKDSVSSWKSWSSLQIPLVVVPVSIDIHSNDIRRGEQRIHQALENFVKTSGLYAD